MKKLQTKHGKRLADARGFGCARYKLIIATAIGENLTMQFTASGDGQSLKLVDSMLKVMANAGQPQAVEDNIQALQTAGFTQEQIDQLIDIGMDYINPPDVEEGILRKAAVKLASMLAYTRRQKSLIGNVEAALLAQEIQPNIKPQHFVATLYKPDGTGFYNFSNYQEVAGTQCWKESNFA